MAETKEDVQVQTEPEVSVDDTARAEKDRIMREAILEGSKDPDNFKMPDGRTLTEVRRDIDAAQQKDVEKLTESTRAAARREGLQHELLREEVRLEANEVGVLVEIPVSVGQTSAPEPLAAQTSTPVRTQRVSEAVLDSPSPEGEASAGRES